jgi:Uncharacterized conserved protein (DUF2249)
MRVHCTDRSEGSRLWHNQEGLHIDVTGLEPPEPMVAILSLIDGGEVQEALIAHLDREPIFLYPELDDRGWSHEIVPSCGGGDCADQVKLRMVRWGK